MNAKVNWRHEKMRYNFISIRAFLFLIYFLRAVFNFFADGTFMVYAEKYELVFRDQDVISQKLVNEFTGQLSTNEFRSSHFLRQTISILYAP